jgi:hypothetical protein
MSHMKIWITLILSKSHKFSLSCCKHNMKQVSPTDLKFSQNGFIKTADMDGCCMSAQNVLVYHFIVKL